MSAVQIVKTDGSTAGEYDVNDALLVQDKGDRVLSDSILAYQAAQRAGTASTKSKGEVAGSNAKPWKQKGTGRARAGYKQSPIWRGGAVAFGPHPRSYKVAQNKKARNLAFRRAVSDKIAAGTLRVIESLEIPEQKTKHFAAILNALEIKRFVLFVVAEPDLKTYMAARNIPNVEIIRASDVHPYHLVRYQDVVVTREGMDELVKRMSPSKASNEEVAA